MTFLPHTAFELETRFFEDADRGGIVCVGAGEDALQG